MPRSVTTPVRWVVRTTAPDKPRGDEWAVLHAHGAAEKGRLGVLNARMSRGRERRDGREEQEKRRLSEQRDRVCVRGSSEEIALDGHAGEERSAEEGDDERQRRRGGVVLAIGEVVRQASDVFPVTCDVNEPMSTYPVELTKPPTNARYPATIRFCRSERPGP